MGPDQVFVWINQFGIPTVFAVILLLFVLYRQDKGQTAQTETLREVGATLVKVSADLTALASAQARQAEVLADVVRTLDRLQARFEAREDRQ